MANIKVSELSEVTTSFDGDALMIVQASESKRISKQNFLKELNDLKTVTFNNEWLICYKITGGGVLMPVTLANPQKENPTINFTNIQIYYNGVWNDVSLYGVGYQTVTTTQVYLRFEIGNLNLTDGNAYLMRIVGTISVD